MSQRIEIQTKSRRVRVARHASDAMAGNAGLFRIRFVTTGTGQDFPACRPGVTLGGKRIQPSGRM